MIKHFQIKKDRLPALEKNLIFSLTIKFNFYIYVHCNIQFTFYTIRAGIVENLNCSALWNTFNNKI